MDYIYRWRNNEKRKQLFGRACRIIATGGKNSICIEFEDGQREIVSRFAVGVPKKPNQYKLDFN